MQMHTEELCVHLAALSLALSESHVTNGQLRFKEKVSQMETWLECGLGKPHACYRAALRAPSRTVYW